VYIRSASLNSHNYLKNTAKLLTKKIRLSAKMKFVKSALSVAKETGKAVIVVVNKVTKLCPFSIQLPLLLVHQRNSEEVT
jgi:hypothetical protein